MSVRQKSQPLQAVIPRAAAPAADGEEWTVPSLSWMEPSGRTVAVYALPDRLPTSGALGVRS